jgi:hypothetical protein
VTDPHSHIIVASMRFSPMPAVVDGPLLAAGPSNELGDPDLGSADTASPIFRGS